MLRGFVASILRVPKDAYKATKRCSSSSVKLASSLAPLTAVLAPLKVKVKVKARRLKFTEKARSAPPISVPISVQASVPALQPASSERPSNQHTRWLSRALWKLRSIPRKLRSLVCIVDPSKAHEVNESEREDNIENCASEPKESGVDPASLSSAPSLSSSTPNHQPSECEREDNVENWASAPNASGTDLASLYRGLCAAYLSADSSGLIYLIP